MCHHATLHQRTWFYVSVLLMQLRISFERFRIHLQASVTRDFVFFVSARCT
ncbi:hypothetical protein KC19_11G025500 [Ceratodon purpureus]|uniref:Uncharacterized protein n=1 Tax=Ceratodon purpureus TaxID=3225 RepID=A0A8T0GBK1_CERPU|nr:hypothetical protein KC19_11G025500 [Ceratodon purpureus]